MNYKNLIAFQTVCEEKNFTSAAEKLFMAQSSLSQQIKTMEEELGQALIRRENRAFELTPAGKVFLEFCHKELRDYDELRKNLSDLSETSIFKIGVFYCLRLSAWSQAIALQNEKDPSVTYSFRFDYGHEKRRAFLNGETPVSLFFKRKDLDEKGYFFQPVFKDFYAIGVSYANPLSVKDELTAEDLKDQTIMHINSSRTDVDLPFIDILIKEGLKPSNFKSMNRIGDMHYAAKANSSIIMMPNELLPPEIKHIPLKSKEELSLLYGWYYKEHTPEVDWVLENLK